MTSSSFFRSAIAASGRPQFATVCRGAMSATTVAGSMDVGTAHLVPRSAVEDFELMSASPFTVTIWSPHSEGVERTVYSTHSALLGRKETAPSVNAFMDEHVEEKDSRKSTPSPRATGAKQRIQTPSLLRALLLLCVR